MRGVFEDHENGFLDIEDIVELDQILMLRLLQKFDFSQSEKRDTLPVLKIRNKLKGSYIERVHLDFLDSDINWLILLC